MTSIFVLLSLSHLVGGGMQTLNVLVLIAISAYSFRCLFAIYDVRVCILEFSKNNNKYNKNINKTINIFISLFFNVKFQVATERSEKYNRKINYKKKIFKLN